ncbi:PAS domain-containing protein [Jannaschia sp. Os4]|uniref:PAS domain-containing protein n=1 Tax=Jannaschia sp. Os4 TaxID=2807617 RepID=UPI00193A333B|nr:PAS domain-containing protein [Jannaschia sp. Os4]MBM2576239.1 PAS domain-containing protein [Jannaschia sp. Os4]
MPDDVDERVNVEGLSGQGLLQGFSRVRVAMVLTDPRADDNPIVYVNDAFERTTGYQRSAVIGRNCRFLQGEETAKRDVDRIRDAVENHEDVSVDILNYRADGRPFNNRLVIAPITDGDDNIIYFLGIQKELGENDPKAHGDDILVKIGERVRTDLAMVLETIGDFSDEGEEPDFEAMSRRLETMQLAYESMKLSDEQEEAGIDLGSLLSRVGAAIAHEMSKPGVRFVQHIEATEVNLDAAVRAALIVSEVLANAFEHAFDRMDEGFVEMRVARLAAGGLRITVTDDGVGMGRNTVFPDPETIGGRLLAKMCDGLDATLTPVRGAAGTVVVVDVPVGPTEL